MKVEFRRTFEKDLIKFQDKALLNQIKSAIEAVERADTLDGVNNIKKLKGEDSYFRIRLGNYRIGLFAQEGVIPFVRILHRR